MATGKPRVYVIGTGGSISCAGESRLDLLNYNYADLHLTIDEMLARIPEANDVADIRAEQFSNIYGGDLAPAQWLELARRIEQIYRDDAAATGVVVTHGTATLEETAFFLNLAVRSANPVVVTGAMRPSTGLGTDADINLYDAIRVAASPDAVGKGVLVMLNNEIQAARDVTKTNTSRIETFKSGELGFLGYADADGKVVFLRAPARAHTAASEFDIAAIAALPRVDIAIAFAGADGVAIKALVAAGCNGIVSAGLGSGSAPRAFLDALVEAKQRGVCVVMASQVGSGRVMAKRAFTEKGFIAADSLAPKKARILLMLALARTRDAAEIQRMFLAY
jgi:L-asparaginase